MTQPPSDAIQRAEAFDFLFGLVGWYIVNGALYGAVNWVGGAGLLTVFIFLLLPLNLLAFLLAALKRRFVAWGIATAVALNFLLAIVWGVFTNGLCGIPFFIEGRWP